MGPEQGNKPELVQGDENGEAEAEDEDGDEEVAVGEDGFGALGFVHGDLGFVSMIDEACEGGTVSEGHLLRLPLPLVRAGR